MSGLLSLWELVLPWLPDDEAEAPDLHCVSMALSQRTGNDPYHVLSYLQGRGEPLISLEDVSVAIDKLGEDDELSAAWVAEGLLVSHASDGFFVLYVR